MNKYSFLIYLALLGAFVKYNSYVDFRPLRVFLNLPFDKQLPYFPEFKKWIEENKGKFNMIQIYMGGEPYFVFTKNFYHNTTDSETINLKKHKKDQITEELINRGFVKGDYYKQVNSEDNQLIMKQFIVLLLISKFLSKLIIQSPSDLVKKFNFKHIEGNIEYSLSIFGNLQYNEVFLVQIVLPDSNNLSGCDELTRPKNLITNHFILLLKRGNCTYSKKTYEAQDIGAFGIIVQDNRDYDNLKYIIPVQDKIYTDLNIPLFLITKQDGNTLREQLDQKKDVMVSIDLIPQKKNQDKLDIEFWINPTSFEGYKFIVNMRHKLEQFKDQLTFTPKYKFQNLQNIYKEDYLRKNCYQEGQFCSIDNKYDSLQVLEEGIRQICMWNISKQNNSIYKNLWWNYIDAYYQCLNEKEYSREDKDMSCHSKIFFTLQLSPELVNIINNCIQTSFSNQKDKYTSSNKLLSENQNDVKYSLIYLVPSILINGKLLRENLKQDIVISAFCEQLINKPDICDNFREIDLYFNNNKDKLGKTALIILLILFLITLVYILIILILKQFLKRNVTTELSSDVEKHVSMYVRIQNNKDEI